MSSDRSLNIGLMPLTGLFAWILLFAMAAINYQGSFLLFSAFSLSFLVLLLVGIYKNKSYVFLFLTLFFGLVFGSS